MNNECVKSELFLPFKNCQSIHMLRKCRPATFALPHQINTATVLYAISCNVIYLAYHSNINWFLLFLRGEYKVCTNHHECNYHCRFRCDNITGLTKHHWKFFTSCSTFFLCKLKYNIPKYICCSHEVRQSQCSSCMRTF